MPTMWPACPTGWYPACGDVAPRVVSRQDLILEHEVAEHVWFMVVRSAALKKTHLWSLTPLQHFRRSQCSHDLR